MKLSGLHDKTVMETDTTFQDMYKETEALVPAYLQPALKAAVAWHPKKKGWGLTPARVADMVGKGQKPIMFGFRNDIIRAHAKGLAIIRYKSLDGYSMSVAFLPTNKEIAQLLIWSDITDIPKHVKHFVDGLCAGYPIDAVVSFALQYKSTDQQKTTDQ